MDSIIYIVIYIYIILYLWYYYINYYGLVDKMVIWWLFKDIILYNIIR